MIRQAEFQKRRQQMMRMTGEDSIVIVCASPERIRNGDVKYPYRQDSDFLYLTGFLEPDALLVMVPGKTGGKNILFSQRFLGGLDSVGVGVDRHRFCRLSHLSPCGATWGEPRRMNDDEASANSE